MQLPEEALRAIFGSRWPRVVEAAGRFWPHGRVVRPLAVPFPLDAERGIGLCGDGPTGDGVAAALASGRAPGARILGGLTARSRVAMPWAGEDRPSGPQGSLFDPSTAA